MSNQLSAVSFIGVLMVFIGSCGHMVANEGPKPSLDTGHFSDVIDADSTIYCDTRFAVCFKIPNGLKMESGYWNYTEEEYAKFEAGHYALELLRCSNTDSAFSMGFNIVNFSNILKRLRESDDVPEELKNLTTWKLYQYDTIQYRKETVSKMIKFGSHSDLKVNRTKIFGTDAVSSIFYYPTRGSKDSNEIDIIYIQSQFLKGNNSFTYYMQLPMTRYFENELYYRKLYMENLKMLISSLRYVGGKGSTTYSNEWFTHEIAL